MDAADPAGAVRVWRALMLALGLTALLLLVLPVVSIPLRIPGNYNEGWGAFFGERAMSGGVLYPDPSALVANNYPPLGFYVLGAAGRLAGDAIAAGRVVALASLLAVAGLVYLAGASLGRRRWAALAALVFLVFNLGFFRGYVAMADPQWFAQAVVTAGLLPLLSRRQGAPGAGAVIAACFLMVAGGLIKQNLLALPIAVTLWLAIQHRRALVLWLATAALAVAAACLLMRLAYGEVVFVDILRHQRRILLGQFPDAVVYLAPMLPLMAAAAVLSRRAWRDARVRLILIYAAVAVPLGVLQRLGEGVNVNGHFEGLVALCMAAGPALTALATRGVRWRGRRWGAAAAALAVALPVLACAPYFLAASAYRLAGLEARKAAWAAALAQVAATPGPAACEILSVCYWAGKGFELDMFNYGQKLRLGASPAALDQALSQGRWRQIILIKDAAYPAGQGRLPVAAVRLIESRYQDRARLPNGLTVMVPRP